MSLPSRHFSTPTALRISSTPTPAPPGTTSRHTLSPTLRSPSKTPQFGLGSLRNHLKSSTWSHSFAFPFPSSSPSAR